MDTDGTDGTANAGAGPENGVERYGRRVFLVGAGAAALGVGLFILNRHRGPVGPKAAGNSADADATIEGVLISEVGLGAPDLGCEMFPDASGHALAQASDAPVILLPRSAWTNQPPQLKHMRVMGDINAITVHHTAATAGDKDAWNLMVQTLDQIEDFHTKERGWADIAYHFVIDRAGRVWQARPLAYQGAHAKLHNEHNLGIVLMGNFQEQRPSAAQLAALTDFLGFLRGLYKVDAKRVFTHGELGQTDCPGKSLQSFMNRLRSKWV